MAETPTSFSDFPNDIQLNILSFLTPPELSAFFCTSRHFSTFSTSPSLYLSICSRRWGSKTILHRWNQPFPRLYYTLNSWDPLLGFWRHIGNSQSLIFFEWGPDCITGSRIVPSRETDSYGVVKVPILWLGISKAGEAVSYWTEKEEQIMRPVSVSFMGEKHMVLQESGCGGADDDELGFEVPEEVEMTYELYRYFANNASPGKEKGLRKQRRRKTEKRKLWEAEHFVKIVNSCPTPERPLQGLWKGICENKSLDFFLVSYDDLGGIACRRVGDTGEPFSGYSPVFWTSNPTFINPPFSKEEQEIYSSRHHIRQKHSDIEKGTVSRMLYINSSYDLVLPNAPNSAVSLSAEGRIWEYQNGTYGFGFLRDGFIVDLKHVAFNGCLLDTVELCGGFCGDERGGCSSSL